MLEADGKLEKHQSIRGCYVSKWSCGCQYLNMRLLTCLMEQKRGSSSPPALSDFARPISAALVNFEAGPGRQTGACLSSLSANLNDLPPYTREQASHITHTED